MLCHPRTEDPTKAPPSGDFGVSRIDPSPQRSAPAGTPVDGTVRYLVYAILIATSVASMLARIASVRSTKGDTPFLSANDRSRWSTIRAIVEERTFAIDSVIQSKSWDSIDKVRHADAEGRQRFYSSKPPLLTSLLACQYWCVHWATGASLSKHPFYVGRIMLVLANVGPLIVYFAVLINLVEQLSASTWSRLFVMAAATWGTFLTSFAVTLNNHIPAAICVLLAVFFAVRIWQDDHQTWGHHAACGFLAAMAAACELPALSFFALMGVVSITRSVRLSLVGFVPAALLVFVAFFTTNYVAHGTLQPPYTQRHVEGGWYDFEGSYWHGEQLKGVDVGETSRLKYAIHSLVGHHGVFSLTPIWIISLYGLARWMIRPSDNRWLATMTVVLTFVCLMFYIGMRPAEDRNYGGLTIGFRWAFWLVPLWTLALLPACDQLSTRRLGRWLCLACLLVSAISQATRPSIRGRILGCTSIGARLAGCREQCMRGRTDPGLRLPDGEELKD